MATGAGVRPEGGTVIYRYSAISTAHFCLTKFRKQYILGEVAEGPKNSNFVFGTAMHLAISSYFKDYADAVSTFKMYWNSIKPDDYSWDRYGYSDLLEIGTTLLRKWEERHAKNYNPLHVEKKLDFTLNSYSMQGTPDFIGAYKNKISVVDWKTSASTFDKRKGLIDGQMWLYVHAAKEVYNIDIEQIVYAPFVKYGAIVQTPIVIEVTKDKLTSMLNNATLVIKDLEARTEWPRNEQNCLRCEFFSGCYQETK